MVRNANFRYDDQADLNLAWSHAVQAKSAWESYQFWKVRSYGRHIYPGCLQSAQRNLLLSRHLSGFPTNEGSRLLTLRAEARRRRDDLREVLPARQLTPEEVTLGPVMGLRSPPRFWKVYGRLDSLESDCDFEGMLQLIEQEMAVASAANTKAA